MSCVIKINKGCFPFRFKTEGVDFKPAVGCIIRAIDGSMRKTDVTCTYVDQSTGILTLENSEELVSNIIKITQTEEERSFTVVIFIIHVVQISRLYIYTHSGKKRNKVWIMRQYAFSQEILHYICHKMKCNGIFSLHCIHLKVSDCKVIRFKLQIKKF